MNNGAAGVICISTDMKKEEVLKILEYIRSGRLYLLPCALGEKVYKISERTNDFTGYTYPVIIQDSFRLDMVDKINKKVFLTMEEANIALNKLMEDKRWE